MDIRKLERELQQTREKKKKLKTELQKQSEPASKPFTDKTRETSSGFTQDIPWEMSAQKLENNFEQVFQIKEAEAAVPPVSNRYLQLNGSRIVSDLPGNRYGYITYQNKKPIFDFSDPAAGYPVSPGYYYRFGVSGSASADLSVELVVVGYGEEGATEVTSIGNNQTETVWFKETAVAAKLLIRIQGKGTIDMLQIGIQPIERRPNYQKELELQPVLWFNPKDSETDLQARAGTLTINSKRQHRTPTYISYQARNNSFSHKPEESAFDIRPGCMYEIDVAGECSGGYGIQPILITYADDTKDEIIPLAINEVNKFTFKEKVDTCRISFKVTTAARFDLRAFVIAEYGTIKENNIQWLDSKEPKLLGLTGRNSITSVKMAAIFDEFTAECFKKECELIQFSPDNWKEVLTASQPDLLMVESAWRGNDGTWKKKIQYRGEESISELTELLDWCKANNIPTVFWNKEDPVHYEHFIETAKLFEFVYTSDANMIPAYKQDCGHENVGALKFAAQPAIHNPITIGEREDGISFAGSYYKKHEERSRDMMRIFNYAKQHNLVIYDRNFEKTRLGLMKNNQFPEELQPYIRGSLKYYEIDKAYKGFKVVINVNTVKQSPTMFARRVFEALASGTPVISNYSEGMKNLFGDIVGVSEKKSEVKRYLESLFENEDTYREVVLKGVRRVLKHHTYGHRLDEITDFLQLPFYRSEKKVTVFGRASNREEVEAILESYRKQTYSAKQLCLLVKNLDMNQFASITMDEIEIYQESNFFDAYTHINEYVDNEYFAFFSPIKNYEETFLEDVMLATLYAPWEIISCNLNKELVFKQVKEPVPERSIYKKEIFTMFSFPDTLTAVSEAGDLTLLLERGARVLEIPG